MNFIVAQLLFHCSEVIAFWLFVELIESCEMRDIYQPHLPGLYKHSMTIEILVKQFLPKLSILFVEHHVKAEIYAAEWIFGLFASVIPVEYMASFFDKFFKTKWVFFYQLILCILEKHQDQIKSEEDFFAVLHKAKAW